MSQEGFLIADTTAFIWPLSFKYDSQSRYCVNDTCAHSGQLECLEVAMTDNRVSSGLPKHEVWVCLCGQRGCCFSLLVLVLEWLVLVVASLSNFRQPSASVKHLEERHAAVFLFWITTCHHTHSYIHLCTDTLALKSPSTKSNSYPEPTSGMLSLTTSFLLRWMSLWDLLFVALFHLYVFFLSSSLIISPLAITRCTCIQILTDFFPPLFQRLEFLSECITATYIHTYSHWAKHLPSQWVDRVVRGSSPIQKRVALIDTHG